MKNYILCSLLAAHQAWALSAPPPPSHDYCETRQQPVPWSYCVTVTAGSTNTDVLYFFHGLTGNERNWSGHWGIRNEWKNIGFNAPTVVSISFGGFWLLAEKTSKPRTGFYDVFFEDIIPYIEAKHGLSGKRMIYGESMGGFNGAQAYLKRQDMFARAALVCPAITIISPKASEKEKQDYIQRTQANAFLAALLFNLGNDVFDTEENWQKHAPISLAEALLTRDSPPLMVSCGKKDEYGFFEGAFAFAETAKARNVATLWDPLSGGHCAYDSENVAHFLAEHTRPD